MAKARGVRSQACDTCGPGRAQRVAQRGKRCQEPKGEKRGPISPSDEIECRKRGGHPRPLRRDDHVLAQRRRPFSGQISLVRSALYGLSAGLIVFPG